MAARGGYGQFDVWLRELLDSYGADGEVFGEYISGTLNTMEDSLEEEIYDSLLEILSGCVEEDGKCERLSREVAQRWMEERQQRRKETAERVDSDTLNQLTTVTAPKPDPPPTKPPVDPDPPGGGGMSAAEKRKLIAQYDCESDEDEELDLAREEESTGGLFQNVNAAKVADGVKQQKEQQKAAHVAKVERDKRSRDVQKQKAQDRKEKEKKRTQKHERRR